MKVVRGDSSPSTTYYLKSPNQGVVAPLTLALSFGISDYEIKNPCSQLKALHRSMGTSKGWFGEKNQ